MILGTVRPTSRLICRQIPSHRLWATTAAENKAFSKTLLLPKTSFPLWTEPSKSEVPFQRRTSDELYRWQWDNAEGPLFVLHDGPPYANGNLHMGHALNKILKDIINRFHMSLGRKVHYIPGWDCHGLPIENKALQELGKDSLALSAATIRSAANDTAVREVSSQKEQFRQFGIMADWDTKSTYRTLDQAYEMRQLRVFQQMVNKGLIYRHYRPVHFSPSSRSALAEAELVYKDNHVSHSVYVSFSLDVEDRIGMSDALQQCLPSGEDNIRLLVWTTTPWTLTANMGIAVHPDLVYAVLTRPSLSDGNEILIVAKSRLEALVDILGPVEELGEVQGSDLVSASYVPLFSSLLGSQQRHKIIPSTHVTADSGTGLVHCAPAHGAEDYNAFRSLGLISATTTQTMLCHVDGAGKFTKEVAEIVGPDAGLIGQEVLKGGSKAIIELLKTLPNKPLIKVEKIKHRYPYDWKTDEPIIVTATSQWFANLDDIKGDALDALTPVKFLPPASRNRLESFVRSRSEWCISRQRVWGVPIPSLHHIVTERAVLDTDSLDHILGVLNEKGVEYWWDGPVEEFVPPSLHQDETPVSKTWRKGTDTMDVWFDSGSSWAMLRDLAGQETREFYADVCLEGSDQHRGWFQSQLLTAVGSAAGNQKPGSPYGTLITHGMVLDQHGKKMSKSLGNIVSPATIVQGGKDKKKEPAYGADTLRLWVATVEYWRDMSIGPSILAQTVESMRKIRNSARFILGNIGDPSQIEKVSKADMGLADRYIMHELYTLEQTALDGYASYNFPKVINALTNFANIRLSSLYFDITKDCLYADGPQSMRRRAVVTVLEQTLRTMTSVLAPVLPHLAEEIHDCLRSNKQDASSFFTTKWAPLSSEWNDPQAEQDMNVLLNVRGVVLSLLEKARGNKHIKSSLEAEVDLVVPGDSSDESKLWKFLQREEEFLKTLFIVSDASIIDEGSLGTTSPKWLYTDSLSLLGLESDLGIRVRPATLDKCPRCWTFTRAEEDVLCGRCSEVVPTSH